MIGVTLSREQADWGRQMIAQHGMHNLAEIRYQDYRNVTDSAFDAVSKLRPGGRLLNHCITRPTNSGPVKAGAFIDRYVFPDGELTGSGRIIAAMQDNGLDVRHSRQPS